MTGKTVAGNRIVEFDLARTLAIFSVVFCHATEAFYPFNQDTVFYLPGTTKLFMLGFITIGRLGVPIFLFLTGALVLKKCIETDEHVLSFYRKSLVPLLIAYGIWVMIYAGFFLATGRADDASIINIVKYLLFLKQLPLQNTWYFPMIIGMYIGIPFIARIVKTFSIRSTWLLISVVFTIGFILPTVNSLFEVINISGTVGSILEVPLLGSGYALYIYLGFLMTGKEVKISRAVLLLIAAVSFAITVGVQIFSYREGSGFAYTVWYDFPFLLICTVCLFLLIVKTDLTKIKKRTASFFTFISRISFGIFLIHVIVIYFLRPYIALIPVPAPVSVILMWFSCMVISSLIIFLLSRIRPVARYALLFR